MADTETIHNLEIDRKDFLDAVRTLKPSRVSVATRRSEFQLGYIEGEAVFCVNGAQTRRPARGAWPGFATFGFGFLLAILKAPPPGPIIKVEGFDSSVRIGTTRVPARWIESPEWIAEMALEVHLHGPDPACAPADLYCPKCGKKEGIQFRDLMLQAGQYVIPEEKIYIGNNRLLGADPTRQCRACGHQWIEMDD